MVLNDITRDYKKLIDLIGEKCDQDNFLIHAFRLRETYRTKLNKAVDTYLASAKRDTDKNNLAAGLNALEKGATEYLVNMNGTLMQAVEIMTKIESAEFSSDKVKNQADEFCTEMKIVMERMSEYAGNKIKGASNSDTFSNLIMALDSLSECYNQIQNSYTAISLTEEELFAILPEPTSDDAEELYELDIRSYRSDLNIESFSADLVSLAKCLGMLERICCGDANLGNTIYIRKIESGSLKAVFSSFKSNLSVISDMISSITEAVKTWKLLPEEKKKLQAETKKTEAETEKIKAETEKTKAETARTEIETQILKETGRTPLTEEDNNNGSKWIIAMVLTEPICEKLQIGANDTEKRELAQMMCNYFISYIERNPVGEVNGVHYDITEHTALLEELEE